MGGAITIPETVEIQAAVLIEACAAVLAVEDLLLDFSGCDTPASDRLNEVAHRLLDAAGASGIMYPQTSRVRPEGPDADSLEPFKHPLVVETYARWLELAGKDAVAERVRLMGDGRAQWDEWVCEQLAGVAE